MLPKERCANGRGTALINLAHILLRGRKVSMLDILINEVLTINEVLKLFLIKTLLLKKEESSYTLYFY